ncbi:MAG TPA: hypothetical protein VGD98_20690 [Ktedonobacteraceae bacterium]
MSARLILILRISDSAGWIGREFSGQKKHRALRLTVVLKEAVSQHELYLV